MSQNLLTDGKEYAYPIDLGRGNSVEVRETWEAPTQEYPKGSYQMLIGGKVEAATGRFAVEGVKEPVPYWHGKQPFVQWNGPTDSPWDAEKGKS